MEHIFTLIAFVLLGALASLSASFVWELLRVAFDPERRARHAHRSTREKIRLALH